MTIRVLVVDDSAFARKVLREVLAREPSIEVVDIARDGLDALEKIALLQPDVVTLDLTMPGTDGLGVLRALPPDGPRVVVVSVSGATSELALEALEAGAVDLVTKPTSLATDRLYELGDELVRKVLAAASATPRSRPAPPAPIAATGLRHAACSTKLLVIGASTGGPPAISRLLGALPANFPVPIAVVVHLPVGYTDSFARRLDGQSALRVREAYPNMMIEPGDAVIARGGRHLVLDRVGDIVVTRLEIEPASLPHCPSVDVLFRSAAAIHGADVLGLVLTGMGDDGLLGSRAIVEAGGRVLTEAESSCVVYGMPRCVDEAKLSHRSAPLEDLIQVILEEL